MVANFGVASNMNLPQVATTEKSSKWCVPCLRWIKINCDGATRLDASWSTIASVVRDSQG